MGVEACQAATQGKTLAGERQGTGQVVTKDNVDAALAAAPKPAAPYDDPFKESREMTTTTTISRTRGRRAATRHWTPAWRAALDPANLADVGRPVALVVLVIVFQVAQPHVPERRQHRVDAGRRGDPDHPRVGQTFVIATAGIDLSIASAMTLGAVVFGQAFAPGWGLSPSCWRPSSPRAAVGVVNGLLIARGKITDFIVTLGTLSAASGLALILADGKPVTIIRRRRC